MNVSLGEFLQINMLENIMLRIAIFEHNKIKLCDRGVCWKAIANFLDNINEKRFNANNRMQSKDMVNFEKLEPLSLIRT